LIKLNKTAIRKWKKHIKLVKQQKFKRKLGVLISGIQLKEKKKIWVTI